MPAPGFSYQHRGRTRHNQLRVCTTQRWKWVLYPQPPTKKVTWQTVVICITEDESGHHQLQERSRGGWKRMLSGRSPVASAGICCPCCPYIPHPHPLHPLCPPTPSQPVTGVADWLTARLSQQMAAMQRPCGTGQGLASRELFLPYTPKGTNPGPWHIQRYTECKVVQTGWVTEVEAAASAHYGGDPPPPTKHRLTNRNYLVDEFFFLMIYLYRTRYKNIFKNKIIKE